MNRSQLFLTFGILATGAVAACGGNVVVDTPGHGGEGAGAQGTAGSVGTGMGGFETTSTSTGVLVGSTGTGTSVPACQSGACSGDSAGACSCTGTCSNGDTAAVSCPGGGDMCTCSLSGAGELLGLGLRPLRRRRQPVRLPDGVLRGVLPRVSSRRAAPSAARPQRAPLGTEKTAAAA